jgi:histidine decarboxylase
MMTPETKKPSLAEGTGSIETRLDALDAKLAHLHQHFLGYPVTTDFDYTPLLRFLRYPLNNIGDPFSDCTLKLGTREFEQEVIGFFADHFRAPVDDYWGYVTNGGTEGNLYGLYLAREMYPRGVVYFCEETHYSVSKNVHFLGMRHIMIRSQESGEMDYEDLRETLRIHRDKPAIIFANLGTTMKEGRDDIALIQKMLDELRIVDRYIHVDCALCGAYLPFMEPKPAFDFMDGANSVAMSGHKFIGSPIPCGVVVARKKIVQRIGRTIGYIGSLDTTITGSRNGFTPLVLWYALQHWGRDGLRARYQKAAALAGWAVQQMQNVGIPAWRNPQALTVVLPKVSDAVRDKWQLATQGVSHLIVMPGITAHQIELLIADLVADYQHRGGILKVPS